MSVDYASCSLFDAHSKRGHLMSGVFRLLAVVGGALLAVLVWLGIAPQVFYDTQSLTGTWRESLVAVLAASIAASGIALAFRSANRKISAGSTAWAVGVALIACLAILMQPGNFDGRRFDRSLAELTAGATLVLMIVGGVDHTRKSSRPLTFVATLYGIPALVALSYFNFDLLTDLLSREAWSNGFSDLRS